LNNWPFRIDRYPQIYYTFPTHTWEFRRIDKSTVWAEVEILTLPSPLSPVHFSISVCVDFCSFWCWEIIPQHVRISFFWLKINLFLRLGYFYWLNNTQHTWVSFVALEYNKRIHSLEK
jgi:hypothetical protein